MGQIDVIAWAAAFFFDFGDPMEFVEIRLEVIVGVVVPGDGVHARAIGLATSHDEVGHANNRAGVHAPA